MSKLTTSVEAESDASPSLFVFDPALLKPGDIVLERAADKESDLITAFDGGDFSHALIWVGGTDFIEAIDGGSRTISYARVGVRSAARWRLLRYCGGGGEALALKAATEARNLVFKPYNLPGAYASVIPVIPYRSHVALFCSELVAVAYERAGEAVVPGLPSEKVTPAMLEGSPKFFSVEPLPLSPLPPELVDEVPLDRSTGYEETLMAKENRLSQEAYRAVAADLHLLKASTKGVRWPPGNLPDVINVLSVCDPTAGRTIAEEVHLVLQVGGYYHLLDEMKAAAIAKAPSANQTEVAGWETSFTRTKHNYEQALAIYLQRPWPLWKSHSEMYKRNAAFFGVLLRAAGREPTV